jgi:hypothetical protein
LIPLRSDPPKPVALPIAYEQAERRRL